MNRYRVTWIETWGEVASAVIEASDITTALFSGCSPAGEHRSVTVCNGNVNACPVVKVELLLETEAERGGGQ